MNILIPHHWLLEHLETDATPDDIQRELSLSGPSVERIIEDDATNEKIYDIEVTTNRVDSMSIRGIAREAAVILKQAGFKAKLKPLSIKKFSASANLPLPKINNDPKLCKRVTCVVLADLNQTPTPQWMAQRLTQAGMNIHNSVIDITNYVTHELGHPCHAFDYDKLMKVGGEINIVEAKKGETFTTLDGETFTTVGGEVVFKNKDGKIIDLPSIKGTANTSVDESTKNVLLLMESIRADKVRFTSMTHAIRTTAAQLMEKHADPHLIEPVLQMGIKLYVELCQGKVGSQIYDQFPGEKAPEPVVVEVATIEQYLGIKLDVKMMKQIMESLECKVVITDNQKVISVQPPTFRPDLNIPADIVEEIARIYGYHNLPSKLMATALPTIYPKGVNFSIEYRVKTFLADIGWQEIYAYSMVSERIALQSGFPLKSHLKLQNYLTEDRIYLRRSLLPSLAEVIEQNPPKNNLSVFEIANVYHPNNNDLPKEQLKLGLVSKKSFTAVRGDIEALLDLLNVDRYQFKVKQKQHLVQIIAYARDKTDPKILGQMTQSINNLIEAELDWKNILTVANTHPKYQPISPIPAITEDLTFSLPQRTLVGDVMSTLKESDQYVSRVEFKEIYQQNATFTIHYHHPTKQLSSAEIEPLRKKLVKNVMTQHQAKLIGKV